MPSNDRPHLILAADVDWPPYAYIGGGPSFDNEGIGADVARGMGNLCDIDITIVQTGWSESPVSEPKSPPFALVKLTQQLRQTERQASKGGADRQRLLDRAGTAARQLLTGCCFGWAQHRAGTQARWDRGCCTAISMAA